MSNASSLTGRSLWSFPKSRSALRFRAQHRSGSRVESSKVIKLNCKCSEININSNHNESRMQVSVFKIHFVSTHRQRNKMIRIRVGGAWVWTKLSFLSEGGSKSFGVKLGADFESVSWTNSRDQFPAITSTWRGHEQPASWRTTELDLAFRWRRVD